MPDAATFHVNGQAQPWAEGLTLAEVLTRQGHAPEAVATALNGQFVARQDRAATALRPGDSVTFFQAIVGG